MTPPRTGTPGHRKDCGCDSCLAHRRRYDNMRILDNAANGPRRIDAAPYRAMLARHLNAGWSPTHLAALIGCSDVAVRAIAAGRTTIVRRSLARRIERATPTFATAPDGVMVPAFGVHRRIQALRRLGWTTGDLQPRLTVSMGTILTVQRVRISTHRAVAALYDDLSGTWGGNPITIRRACRAGYVPPAGWDDIDTDPEPPHTEGKVTVAEEAEWLARTGVGWEDAAARLGYTDPESLERALYRAGRQDLITRLKLQRRAA